jgi:hypothetical protein
MELQLTAEVQVNIYTDSKYAFTAIYIHGALYKERGLITSGGKSIKYGQEILKLLDAVQAPKWVAVIHCRVHQKGDIIIARGNWRADREAKQAALNGRLAPTSLTAALFPCPLVKWDSWYASQEQACFKTEKESKLSSGQTVEVCYWLHHHP